MQTYREFSQHNPLFRAACEAAKIPPTRRQAAKWHQGRGKARAFQRQAEQALSDARAEVSNG